MTESSSPLFHKTLNNHLNTHPQTPGLGSSLFEFPPVKWEDRGNTSNEVKIMKTVKCDLCDVTADGETFEDWMNALMPHYAEVHADVMSDSSRTKADMEEWMATNKARFEAA
jgi:hypothetical protein